MLFLISRTFQILPTSFFKELKSQNSIDSPAFIISIPGTSLIISFDPNSPRYYVWDYALDTNTNPI